MTDIYTLWQKCLGEIELEVSKPNFTTWFKQTFIVRDDEGILIIGVPNEFVKDWLNKKYHKLIMKALMNNTPHVRSIEFVIAKYDQKPQPTHQHTGIEKNTYTKELPLENLYINKDDNLNPRYTFDTFIIGTFNQLAHAAGQAIMSRPGVAYNPFFIYGNTGLGKTHLIQAIGNGIKKRFPEIRVHYITLEKFATDYINATQVGKGNQFKEKYRKYDVLIIDDIQFVGKMEKTQEELFHTFNAFYETNKQIIFSSDKHPNFIPGLEDRLRSRFSQGMIVDVIEPDFESRMSIVQAKTRAEGIELEPKAIELVAEAIQGNIREIEGLMNTIVLQTNIKKGSLSLSEIQNILKNTVKPKKIVSTKEIVKTVAGFYNLEENMIYDKTRRKEIVRARQIIMYILREDFNISYPVIGQKLGGKDHTTVIHSYEKVKKDLQTDPQLQQEYEQLKSMCK